MSGVEGLHHRLLSVGLEALDDDLLDIHGGCVFKGETLPEFEKLTFFNFLSKFLFVLIFSASLFCENLAASLEKIGARIFVL